MGGCLRATAAFITSVGWPARLCSASISPAATQVPPFFSHNMQKKSLSHEYQRRSAGFIPLWRALYRTETRVNIRKMSGDRSDAQSVIHLLCALCLSQTHSRSLSRWIHLQRRRGGQGGCSDWNSTQIGGIKSRLTAEKSRLIHRSLQEDFRWEESSLFRRLFLCVWLFFSYYRERIVVGNPFLPIRELLSPPCVQMMTMATKLARKNNEHNFR